MNTLLASYQGFGLIGLLLLVIIGISCLVTFAITGIYLKEAVETLRTGEFFLPTVYMNVSPTVSELGGQCLLAQLILGAFYWALTWLLSLPGVPPIALYSYGAAIVLGIATLLFWIIAIQIEASPHGQ